MTRSVDTLKWMVLLLPCCLCCACSGRHGLSTYSVQGKVFYLDKPTPRAVVYLHPLDEANKTASIRPCGLVQEDGSFTLTTYKPGDGAPAGHYGVSVFWTSPSKVGDRDVDNLLPERYASPATSGLTVEIKEESNELAPFQLSR